MFQVCVQKYMHEYRQNAYTDICINAYKHVSTYIQTHIKIDIHANMNTYSNIYKYTYTRTNTQPAYIHGDTNTLT